MDLLREGASARDGEHVLAERLAQWVWDFAAPGFGPGGGWKLVEAHLSKPADALRAVSGDPGLAPYKELAVGMRAHGHHATLALLIAAGTVRRSLDNPRQIAAIMEGVLLARRQAAAWLAAHANPATPADAIGHTDALLPARLLDGLPELVITGEADLERVAVHGADVDEASWSPGIPITVHGEPGPVRVLVIDDIVLAKPRTSASLRLGAASAAADWEDGAIESLRARIRGLGVGLLVTRKGVPEDLEARLRFDGVAVSKNAGKTLVARIQLATGADPTASVWTASAEDLGEGTLTRRIRRGDFLLGGPGPTATLEVPGQGPARTLAEERAEAWLRTVGAVWDDPRVVAGGGAWQRGLARALRASAPHAPGKASQGMDMVARVFDDIAVVLLRNLGLDPSRQDAVPGVLDAYVCVLAAVRAGLDTAEKILRIDGRFRKRRSNPKDLRGNLGPSGSPLGMPGDIPPDM